MTNPPSPYMNNNPTTITSDSSHASTAVKSSSFWGGVIAVVGFVMQPQVLAVLPEKAAGIIMGVGTLLSVFGFRKAIAKNGNGQ